MHDVYGDMNALIWLEKIKFGITRINEDIGYRDSKYYGIFTVGQNYDKGICQVRKQKNKLRLFLAIPKAKEFDEHCDVVLIKNPRWWRYSQQYPTRFDVRDSSDIGRAICLIDTAYIIRD
jgi:hypothetical protein